MKYSVQGITLMNVVYTVWVGETTDYFPPYARIYLYTYIYMYVFYIDTGSDH